MQSTYHCSHMDNQRSNKRLKNTDICLDAGLAAAGPASQVLIGTRRLAQAIYLLRSMQRHGYFRRTQVKQASVCVYVQ